MSNISHWLEDEAYKKAEGQWRLQAANILDVFNMYGQGDYINGAVAELEEITIDFSLRVRGDKDKPIRLKSRRNPRRD